MTRHTQYLAGLAVAALAAATLSACNSGAGLATSTPTTTSTKATSTPTTTATPTKSPEDVAIEAAKAKISEYFAQKDHALTAPATFDPNSFKTVAISTGLIELQNTLNAAKQQEVRQIGATSVESMENPRVDLKLDLKKTPPDVPTVQLDVCYDVSSVNLVDTDDKSVVPADRVPRGVMLVGVGNYSYPEQPSAWRVAFTKTLKGKEC